MGMTELYCRDCESMFVQTKEAAEAGDMNCPECGDECQEFSDIEFKSDAECYEEENPR